MTFAEYLEKHPGLDPAQLAAQLDSEDELSKFRSEFFIPTKAEVAGLAAAETPDVTPPGLPDAPDAVYLIGNSLGLQPKSTPEYIAQELQVWRTRGVFGHHVHTFGRPWVENDISVAEDSAPLVGARASEVACMSSLTGNLHTLFTAFYKPTPARYRIVFERDAFPSDVYAFRSQAAMHGFGEEALLPIGPRPGERTLRTEDILSTIAEHGPSIAVVCLSAIQFRTGQYFDIPAITAAAHAQGCLVGFDCAHAAGNVPLELHDWGVDFAVWCTYKYMNAGPGGIGGLFVHERWADRTRLAGWWGQQRETRFDMLSEFTPLPGAAGWQHSNPSALDIAALDSSLQVFKRVAASTGTPAMLALRAKSILITGYLEWLFCRSAFYTEISSVAASASAATFSIITPRKPAARGAQLSLLFSPVEIMPVVSQYLQKAGVVVDERREGVLRVSPMPLYSTFQDCYRAATIFESVMEHLKSKN